LSGSSTTFRSFCATYKISRTTAYEQIKAGKLKVRKVGRATRIASEDAEAWFAACVAGLGATSSSPETTGVEPAWAAEHSGPA
jgi:excisionase family DNA binding protein